MVFFSTRYNPQRDSECPSGSKIRRRFKYRAFSLASWPLCQSVVFNTLDLLTRKHHVVCECCQQLARSFLGDKLSGRRQCKSNMHAEHRSKAIVGLTVSSVIVVFAALHCLFLICHDCYILLAYVVVCFNLHS